MAYMIRDIRGIVVKQPSELEIETFNLTKGGRLASGKMTIDIIAKKRKFYFAYEVLSGPEFDKIRLAIDHPDYAFFPLNYRDNNVDKTAIVYAGAIKARRFRTDGIWYWRDVKFDLIEQ